MEKKSGCASWWAGIAFLSERLRRIKSALVANCKLKFGVLSDDFELFVETAGVPRPFTRIGLLMRCVVCRYQLPLSCTTPIWSRLGWITCQLKNALKSDWKLVVLE